MSVAQISDLVAVSVGVGRGASPIYQVVGEDVHRGCATVEAVVLQPESGRRNSVMAAENYLLYLSKGWMMGQFRWYTSELEPSYLRQSYTSKYTSTF